MGLSTLGWDCMIMDYAYGRRGICLSVYQCILSLLTRIIIVAVEFVRVGVLWGCFTVS